MRNVQIEVTRRHQYAPYSHREVTIRAELETSENMSERLLWLHDQAARVLQLPTHAEEAAAKLVDPCDQRWARLYRLRASAAATMRSVMGFMNQATRRSDLGTATAMVQDLKRLCSEARTVAEACEAQETEAVLAARERLGRLIPAPRDDDESFHAEWDVSVKHVYLKLEGVTERLEQLPEEEEQDAEQDADLLDGEEMPA
jgi:hypothetical protein